MTNTRVVLFRGNQAYAAIENFYGNRRAERSEVRLMQHIDEGLDLLISWERPLIELEAFAIHPLVQNDEGIDVSWSVGYGLACEYRDKANIYLCRPENDRIKHPEQLTHRLGDMSESCAYLLLADKIQNQKDFRQYHLFTHERRHQLEAYFNLWIDVLLFYYINVGELS